MSPRRGAPAGALLAFLVPPAILFAVAWLLIDPNAACGIAGGTVGHGAWFVALFGSPIAGFLLMCRSLGRWRGFDRGERMFVVGLSVFYWALYIPALISLLKFVAVA